jgi:hypothetical protein
MTTDKTIANLGARFALLGHELRIVTKGDEVHCEVRRWGQTRTVITLHDLEGFLVQIGGRA